MRRRPAQTTSFNPLLVRIILVGLVLLAVFTLFRLKVAWDLRVWRGEERLTLAIASQPPVLASWQPEIGVLTLVTLPPRLEVSSAFGYGRFPAENLFSLGEQKGLGGLVLAKTLEKELGVPVDGWLDERGLALFGYQDTSSVAEGKVRGIPLGSPLSYLEIFKKPPDSNFTIFDRVKIIISMAATPQSKREILDLVELQVAQPTKLADGLEGFRLSQTKSDAVLQKKLSDLRVVREGVTVSVINTTQVAGTASKVARVVNGLGARVVLIDAKEQSLESCQVRYEQRIGSSLTLRRITQLFACSQTLGEPAASEIEVVLGEREALQFQD